MKANKALALVLAFLTLLSLAGTALAAPASFVVNASSLSSLGGGSDSSASTGSTAPAQTTGTIVNCTSWVSLRKAANTTSTRLAKPPKGATVTVLGESGSYYQVSYNGQTGYVSKQYVAVSAASTGSAGSTGSTGASGSLSGSSGSSGSLSGSSTGSTAPAQTTGTIVNCTSWVSLRKAANSTSARLAKPAKGATVTVLGQSGNYYQVSYNGQTGYISKEYVAVSAASAGSTGSTGASGSLSSSGSSLGGSSSGSSLGGSTGSTGSSGSSLGGSSGSSLGGSTGSSGSLSSSGSTAGTGAASTGSGSASFGQSVGGRSYAKYTGTTADRWGTIQVPGTKINDYIWCNALNSKNAFVYNEYSSSKNYIYAMSYLTDSIAVISGHNMRVSQTGLHDLHHVQNAWLGKAKCDYTKRCSASCSGAKTSVFNISYNGSSRWQLVCFYEIDSSTVSSKSVREQIMYLNWYGCTATGSNKEAWLNSQLSYANSKYRGMQVSDVSANDKLMIIMTCADQSGDDFQRLYMVLKAIG